MITLTKPPIDIFLVKFIFNERRLSAETKFGPRRTLSSLTCHHKRPDEQTGSREISCHSGKKRVSKNNRFRAAT
jgi:hypothetical protein